MILQVPQLAIDQISKVVLPSLPAEYLNYIAVFSLVFFLLSLIRLNLKLRILAGVFAAIALVAVNFLPAVISSKASPFISMIASITKSLGMQNTLIASGVLIAFGLVLGRLTGKLLFKKVVKKAGEPTTGMENKLKGIERKRDHLISQLKGAKGDPVKELKIEKQINKVNEKINILKAKLGLPITA